MCKNVDNVVLVIILEIKKFSLVKRIPTIAIKNRFWLKRVNTFIAV